MKDNLSFVELILIPRFLDLHKDMFAAQSYDTARYESSAVAYDDFGYRIDFADQTVQLLWKEWQAAALVVISSVGYLCDYAKKQA